MSGGCVVLLKWSKTSIKKAREDCQPGLLMAQRFIISG